VIELVFLLEELSARVMLEGVLPRLSIELPPVRYIVFDGKNDLERNVTKRIRGYRNPDAKFIVARDQDSEPDCIALKRGLAEMCAQAGRSDAIIRIFCCELESFYLADLRAVEAGLGFPGLAKRQGERKFRQPDFLRSPSRELKALTKGLYQKVGGSRAIGHHLDIGNVRSASFGALISGIRRACAANDQP